MRQMSATVNRTVLAILGVVLLLAGLTTLAVSRGMTPAGTQPPLPAASDPLLGSGRPWDHAWFAVIGVVVGAALVALALWWLLAQVPRKNEAKPLRLHDSASTGLSWCSSSVLADAVEAHARSLPEVTGCSAVLRGSATRPELVLEVTVEDRCDVAQVVERITHEVAGGLSAALDAPLDRLAVQLEVSRSARQVTGISL